MEAQTAGAHRIYIPRGQVMRDALAQRFLSPSGRAHVREAVSRLAKQFPSRVSTNASHREQHGRGEGQLRVHVPDAVVWPEETAEVSAIAKVCAHEEIPLIAFGAGTSLEGHVCAPYGGICVDLSRMNQILAVHAEDADCVVQSGVTREQLDAYLRDTGLYFPVDPGANATIGGMVATRASGTTTVHYGATAQNVAALEVVLADGRTIRCGTRALKSSAGYDLVRIFAGSEGTLGIITEVTLRLHARPEATGCMTCPFPDLRQAIDAVIELIQSGTPLLRIEFLDEVQIRACNQYSDLKLQEKPTLFIEIAGSTTSVADHIDRARTVILSHGGVNPSFATSPEQRTQLWRARHQAYYAARALRPGWNCIVSDVCVPISTLADAVSATRHDIDVAGLLAPIFGHVGDGNFHVIFLYDPAVNTQQQAIVAVCDAMIARALAAGGTCTGEHGIGLGKRAKLIEESGDGAVSLMRQLKQSWDPNGILNPGKIFQ